MHQGLQDRADPAAGPGAGRSDPSPVAEHPRRRAVDRHLARRGDPRQTPVSEDWQVNRWPLIEQRMTRQDCLRWLERYGYPTPPKSSCVGCAFHSDAAWRAIRDDDPEAWASALEVDRAIRVGIRRRSGRGVSAPLGAATRSGEPVDRRRCGPTRSVGQRMRGTLRCLTRLPPPNCQPTAASISVARSADLVNGFAVPLTRLAFGDEPRLIPCSGDGLGRARPASIQEFLPMQSSPCIQPVLVFGSNLAGRHGKGAALWARQHRGAVYGQGVGPQGNAYADPDEGSPATRASARCDLQPCRRLPRLRSPTVRSALRSHACRLWLGGLSTEPDRSDVRWRIVERKPPSRFPRGAWRRIAPLLIGAWPKRRESSPDPLAALVSAVSRAVHPLRRSLERKRAALRFVDGVGGRERVSRPPVVENRDGPKRLRNSSCRPRATFPSTSSSCPSRTSGASSPASRSRSWPMTSAGAACSSP